MNTRNRSNYNNSRTSTRYNIPGQFVAAAELTSSGVGTSVAQHYDYYQQPQSQPQPQLQPQPQQPQVSYVPTTTPKEPTNTPTINTNLQQVQLQTSDVEMNESSSGPERPKWMKSKLQGVKKISNKERRRRQNQTLRRLLTPKNALMVLNEMVPHEQVANQFKVEPSQLPNQHYYTNKNSHTFAAELTLEGSNYKGYGENKLSARNACAELAIRDIIIKKMNKMMAVDGSTNGTGEEGDEDSLPMLQLASFALHKLFSEWEYDGHKVPHLKPQAVSDAIMSEANSVAGASGEGAGAGAGGEAGAAGRRKSKKANKKPHSVPSNASAMHPCMLLTYLRPNLEYRELDAQGDKPQNMTYTVGVTVDGHVYTGQASSKKEARKEAAKSACQNIFNIVFDAQVTANAPVHD